MSNIIQFTQAIAYANDRTMKKWRRGQIPEPQLGHLVEVAQIVAEATGGRDPQIVVAAILHDTLEDGAMAYDELALTFGENVAALVQELKVGDGLRPVEAPRPTAEAMAGLSNRAKVVKLADLISNLRALTQTPPADLDLEAREEFVTWAEDVGKDLYGVNRHLETELKNATLDARKAVKTQRYGK